MLPNPAMKGYHAIYRENQINHCPGCGRTHWLIGRSTAECAFCTTAIPMEASFSKTPRQAVIKHKRMGK